MALYPPSGLDDDRNFFSRPVASGEGRLYVGLMPQSVSQASAVIAAASPLLELPEVLAKGWGHDEGRVLDGGHVPQQPARAGSHGNPGRRRRERPPRGACGSPGTAVPAGAPRSGPRAHQPTWPGGAPQRPARARSEHRQDGPGGRRRPLVEHAVGGHRRTPARADAHGRPTEDDGRVHPGDEPGRPW